MENSREGKKASLFLLQTPSVLDYAVAFTAGKGIFFCLK